MSSNIRVIRICQHCHTEFTAKTTVTQYCGDRCAKAAYKLRKMKDKIAKSDIETQSRLSMPADKLSAKEFLSIVETAVLTGVSVRTVQRLIERGSLKVGKLGTRTIIHKKQLEKLFQ
jgi:excisionase family DNA binding protein